MQRRTVCRWCRSVLQSAGTLRLCPACDELPLEQLHVNGKAQ